MANKIKGTRMFVMADFIGNEQAILAMYKVRRKRVNRWVRCFSTDRVLRLTTSIKKIYGKAKNRPE